MSSDRGWMYKRLDGKFLSSIFANKVDEFINFASVQENILIDGLMKCPCSKCENIPYQSVDTIKLHLYKNGFQPDYYRWTCHGEGYFQNSTSSSNHFTSTRDDSNQYTNMVMDAFGHEYVNEDVVEEDPPLEQKKFFEMLAAAEKPLYNGSNMSLLSIAARITNIKCEYNIPHRAVDCVTSLMKDMCPGENNMTDNFYRTRKLLDGLELPHHKIDICPNGCMLFWKEHKDLVECVVCKEVRFKPMRANGKKSPKSVLHYLPIAPRLQRLYATKSTAKLMRWHAEFKRPEGVMAHPSDGKAWIDFDKTFPDFAKESRNIRLGLCTDGFSPFGKSGKQYSCWPVIVTPYNLPPWLCLKKPFMFLSLLIPGPKSPKGNLDIFLQPLIDELKMLWDVGVPTFDVSKKQNFHMKAALLWTISDFPAYGMLSGWSTAGRLACPYCMEKTKSFTLTHGRKQTWFDCHRQFLPHDHVFRKNKSGFYKNRIECSSPPPRLSGDQIWERVSSLPKVEGCSCGNTKIEANGVSLMKDTQEEVLQRFGKEHNWTKESIFWKLLYWSKLLIRHNLDVMHIEKNVFDNLFHTIMDVKGKSKDNIESRKDIQKFCKRQKLEIQDVISRDGKSKKQVMPNASYVLPKEKRKLVCEWVKKLKFPDGYASNLIRCVDTKECKLFGMKSHDCHVFMQRLLPIALKDVLPNNVWNVVTELSQFFRDLCSTTLKVDEMVRLENNIAEILCKLERILPPSFFNSMEHLPIHLPYEAKVGGPVQFRWMYPFERFLYHLKKKIGNKAQVEGSICNAYLTEEISNFCSMYFDKDVDTKVNTQELVAPCVQEHLDLPEIFSSVDGHSSSNGKFCYLDERDYNTAHRYVLNNSELLSEYERAFEEKMIGEHSCNNTDEVWTKYEDKFPSWFKENVLATGVNDDIIYSLALGPSTRVQKFKQYRVNGFHFHTFDYGKHKSNMNYGVCVKGVQGNDYYGILQEIIELVYFGAEKSFKTLLFKCDWFDPGQGTRTHEKYKIVEVNHIRKYPKYDPFVLAYQAEQVYLTPCPTTSNEINQWWVVFNIKARGIIDAPNVEVAFQEDFIDSPSLLSDADLYVQEDKLTFEEIYGEKEADNIEEGEEEDDGMDEDDDNDDEEVDEYEDEEEDEEEDEDEDEDLDMDD